MSHPFLFHSHMTNAQREAEKVTVKHLGLVTKGIPFDEASKYTTCSILKTTKISILQQLILRYERSAQASSLAFPAVKA